MILLENLNPCLTSHQQRHAWQLWQAWNEAQAFERQEHWRWTDLRRWILPREQAALRSKVQAVAVQDDGHADLVIEKQQIFSALARALTVDEACRAYRVAAGQSGGLDIEWQPSTAQGISGACLQLELEEGSQAALLLKMLTPTQAHAGWIDLKIGTGAKLDVALLLQGGEDSAVHWQVNVQQGKNSEVHLHSLSMGTGLARLEVLARLCDENAAFHFGGLHYGRAEAVLDHHLEVRHQAPACTSRQINRSLLMDKAFSLFDGTIYVAPQAQKTDAAQNSRALLLSPQAEMQAHPRLEIHADDVQCRHGATSGFLDPETLFYLRSRGVARQEAQQLMVMSFLREALPQHNRKMYEHLQKYLFDFSGVSL